MRTLIALLLVLATFTALPAQAHKASDAYLTLNLSGDSINGWLDLHLQDLDYVLELDEDGDGAITRGELREKHAAIQGFVSSGMRIAGADVTCPISADQPAVEKRSDGAYAVLPLRADCRPVPGLVLTFDLFFDVDSRHRAHVRIHKDDQRADYILDPDNRTLELTAAARSVFSVFGAFFVQGVRHIFEGVDHILFLLALLAPAALIRRDGGWVATKHPRAALVQVVKIVTAFTIAHSITLCLAASGLVALPPRFVEATIAATVVLAALNNIWPLVTRRLWAVTFSFGLIHGFGFANVLGELDLPAADFAFGLAAFNLGVEAGQIAIVGVAGPLLILLSRIGFYRNFGLQTVSASVMLIGLVWLAERTMNVDLIALI